MNRTQRRRQMFSRQRGVGFTRQFSSRRARLQHGATQKLSRKYQHILNQLMAQLAQSEQPVVKDAAGIQAHFTDELVIESQDLSDVRQAFETFDLLGNDETPTDTPADLSTEGSEALDQYLNWSARDLVASVVGGDFDLILSELRRREADDKSRITVLKAIDARIKARAEAVNTSGVLPPEGVVFGQTTAAELAARRTQ